MPASLAASARLMPSRALAIASMRSAARRFGSCRACRRSASGISSPRIGSAAPIVPSHVGRRSCRPGEHAATLRESQFIRPPVLSGECRFRNRLPARQRRLARLGGRSTVARKGNDVATTDWAIAELGAVGGAGLAYNAYELVNRVNGLGVELAVYSGGIGKSLPQWKGPSFNLSD